MAMPIDCRDEALGRSVPLGRHKAVPRSLRAARQHDTPKLFRSSRYPDPRCNGLGKPQEIIFPHARWERWPECTNKFMGALICSVLILPVKHEFPFWRSPLNHFVEDALDHLITKLDVVHRGTLPPATALRRDGGE